ncbi:MAG: hypothetical protein DKINENOH_04988 [bacterium]|nr:hypothetical protein [bacterium]
MTHPPESLIEAYVRHPDDLSAVQRDAIAGHLAGCRACHEVGEYLRSFYLELEALQHKTSLQVEQWLQKHSAPAQKVTLHPFKPQREVLRASDGYTVVLAALTHEPPALRFQTVATFTSAGQNVLLRLLRDNASDSFRLYLLADPQSRRAHALVSFPALALEVLTDEKGRAAFTLAAHVIPKDWEAVQVVLRFPVHDLQLHAAALGQDTVIWEAAGHVITLAYVQGTLTLEALPQKANTPACCFAALTAANGQVVGVALHNGKGVLALAPLPETLTLRFYC